MKILVVPRMFVEKNLDILKKEQVISIYSSKAVSDKDYSPFDEDHENILKLQFDDAEEEIPTWNLILFNEEHAKKIKEWIKGLDLEKTLYIHCDAGISRSGAVGDVLNDYFNKYIEDNFEDYEFFKEENSRIFPNHLVKRILLNTLIF